MILGHGIATVTFTSQLRDRMQQNTVHTIPHVFKNKILSKPFGPTEDIEKLKIRINCSLVFIQYLSTHHLGGFREGGVGGSRLM